MKGDVCRIYLFFLLKIRKVNVFLGVYFLDCCFRIESCCWLEVSCTDYVDRLLIKGNGFIIDGLD